MPAELHDGNGQQPFTRAAWTWAGMGAYPFPDALGRSLITQLHMDLDKPKEAQTVVDEILARYPKLAALPRYGWRNKKAWKRLRLARRFLLDKDKHAH